MNPPSRAPGPVPHPTRQFTPASGFPIAAEAESESMDGDLFGSQYDSQFDSQYDSETDLAPRQFAGIDIDEFAAARQRSRRAVLFWVLTVLVLTGLVAVAAWTVGLNFQGIIGH